MRACWVVAVLLGLLLAVQGASLGHGRKLKDQNQTLQQIAALIKSRGEISPATIGKALYAQALPPINQASSLSVTVVNVTIDNNVLQVWAKTSLWDLTVQLSLTFFFATSQDSLPQLQLQFSAVTNSLTTALKNLRLPANNDTFPAPSWTSELDLVGSVQVVLSTFAYNGYQPGVTFSSVTTISSGSSTLLPAFETLRPASVASAIQLNTNIYAPLFTSTPTALTLSLQESGAFALTSAIQCSGYQLNLVSGSQQSTIKLSAALQMAIKSQSQPLNVAVSANWKSGSPTTFAGTLTNTWSNAFGLSWLSVSSATLTVVVGSSVSVDSISFAGSGSISFSSSSTPAKFTATLSAGGDYLLSVSNIPIGSTLLDRIYHDLTGQDQAPYLGGVSLSGTASFSVSTYNSGQIKKGFTLNANVNLASSGKLYKIASALQSSVSAQFSLSFYVPLFSSQTTTATFQVVLSETSSFSVAPHIKVDYYTITLSVAQGSPTVTIVSQIELSTSGQSSPVQFALNGQWNDQKESISFTGALSSTWQNAFGLNWLTLESGTLAIVASGGSVSSASLSGLASLTFFSSPVTVLFNIKGDGNFAVYVAGIPLTAFSGFYSHVAKQSPPPLWNDLAVQGALSFSLATYDAPQTPAGLTINVKATISSSSSLFYKAAKVLQSSPSTTTYTVTLFVPVYGPDPEDIKFDLSETGASSLSKTVSIDSYSIDVSVASGGTTVTLNAELAITLPHESQPVVFDASAVWSEAASDVTFTGTLKSPWSNAFGLNWMTLDSGSISLTLGSSSGADKLSVSGSATVSFAPAPVQLAADIAADGNFRLSVTNLPINTIVFAYLKLVGSNPPSSLWGATLKQGSASFTVATYSGAGFQEGFTLQAQATLLEGQQLTQAAGTLLSSPTTLNYQMSFYIPIFSATPEDITLTFSESGSFHLTNSIECESFALSLKVQNQDITISLSTDVSIALSQQQPVSFDISGQFDEQGSVSFTGSLQGTWQKPFGLSWLQITGASVQLAVSEATVTSLSFQADSTVTLDNGSEQVSLDITTANDFTDFTISASSSASWTFAGVAKSVVQKDFPVLYDMSKASTATFSLILSNYAHGTVKSGLTLDTKGTIQGNLLSHVSGLTTENLGTIEFELALNIPIFSADPADVSVYLLFDDQIKITDSFFYEGIKFEVDAMPLAVSVDTSFLATFKKNPPLTFDIAAQITEDGSALFTGEMIGTWDDVFGFKGFSLSNIIIEFGINPSMCAVDACISDLGLGFKMQMGTKTISFDGNAAAPGFEDLFLAGSVDGANGMALTMRDVVREWNYMFPALSVPISDVPQGWGLKDVSFSFAPEDGHFGNVYYPAGFAFAGGINLLDMDLDFAVNCTDANSDFCNFHIHIDLDWDLFKHMIEKELRLVTTDSALVVFSIEDLSLSEWSVQNYAQRVYPYWQIRLKIFDKSHLLQFRVEQYELAGSFHEFFKKWLASVFGV